TADICRERGIEVDLDGFEVAMENQRQMARASGKFKTSEGLSYSGVQTRFDGYTTLEGSGTVTALYVDGTSVQSVAQGQQAVVVLDATPFYAESGGQVGDAGILSDAKGLSFEVQDTQKISNQVFGHQGVLNAGTLTVGQTVQAQVDTERRERVIRNHSATHLMHKALRQVLGGHVQQRGSLVDAEKTR